VRDGEEIKEEGDPNSYDADYLFLLPGYSYRVESAFIEAKKRRISGSNKKRTGH
jgi:hypothetical protein